MNRAEIVASGTLRHVSANRSRLMTQSAFSAKVNSHVYFAGSIGHIASPAPAGRASFGYLWFSARRRVAATAPVCDVTRRLISRGWSFTRQIMNAIQRHNTAVVAAGIAFYGLLAIFPMIAAITALWGLLFDPVDIERNIEPLVGGLPDEAAAIIIEQAKSVASDTSTGISIAALAGLALALFSASKGMRALIDGFNAIYEVGERRGFIRYHLVALGLIVATGLVMVSSFGAIMAVPALLNLFGYDDSDLLTHLRWPILFVVTVLVLEFLYSYAPNRGRPRFKWLSPAALAATLVWVVASVLFSVYVRNFASYNETYGSIGAVVILLVWFWLSAFIVLVGAEIDAGMDRDRNDRGR